MQSSSSSITKKDFVHVEVGAGGVAVVTIRKEPVNSMNLQLVQELRTTLGELEADRKVRAAIFCSGLERNVFTAGNDINELCSSRTTKERYAAFWRAEQEFLARLYVSRLVTCAAIKGQCPAGGCILALVCDFRVMTSEGNPAIGLNEVALGIPPPKWWCKVMSNVIGPFEAERMLMFAKMVPCHDALKMGLVDAVVTSDALMATAHGLIKHGLTLPDLSRSFTKTMLRGELSKGWLDEIDAEIERDWPMLTTPQITRSLEAVLQRLSNNTSAAPAKAKL